MALEGLDYYSRVSQDKLNEFKQNGISFICRYYCPLGYSSKLLTKEETQEISNAGMDVVPVYETNSTYASYFTYNQGYEDCLEAISRAEEVGQLYNGAIYFAVDCDMRNNLDKVYNYFHGISDAMIEYYHCNGDKWYIGVYGGYDVIKYMKNKWGVTHTWQTKAWSDDNIYDYHNIYQYEVDTNENPVYFCGIRVDRNSSLEDTGGFRI